LRYESLKLEKEHLDHEIEENDQEILELETARQNNDVGRTLANFNDQLAKKGAQYTEQKQIVTELKDDLKREMDLLRQVVELSPNTVLSQLIKYYSSNEENVNVADLQNYLEQAVSVTSGYYSALQVEKSNLEK